MGICSSLIIPRFRSVDNAYCGPMTELLVGARCQKRRLGVAGGLSNSRFREGGKGLTRTKLTTLVLRSDPTVGCASYC